MSVDGHVDWFQADAGPFYELASQGRADALLAGNDTMLAAYVGVPEDGDAGSAPAKTDSDGGRAMLVVPDSRGRLRHWSRITEERWWHNATALVSNATLRAYLAYLREQRRAGLAGRWRVDGFV